MKEIKEIKAVPAPAENITIPVAEYNYLTRLDALMDVLLSDETYRSTNTVDAVKLAVLAMRNGDVVGAGV